MSAQAPSFVVFDREGHLASLQRPVSRTMGSFNNGLVGSEQALLKELVIGRELVLLNWSDDWDELIELIKAIRNKKTSPDPFVGIVVASQTLNQSNSRGDGCWREFALGGPVFGGTHHDPHSLRDDQTLTLHRRAKLFWSRSPRAQRTTGGGAPDSAVPDPRGRGPDRRAPANALNHAGGVLD